MQFNEADKIVGEMFPGKHRSISFKQTVFTDGRVETDCGIYVEERGFHTAPTFQAAISQVVGFREESQIIDDTPAPPYLPKNIQVHEELSKTVAELREVAAHDSKWLDGDI